MTPFRYSLPHLTALGLVPAPHRAQPNSSDEDPWTWPHPTPAPKPPPWTPITLPPIRKPGEPKRVRRSSRRRPIA